MTPEKTKSNRVVGYLTTVVDAGRRYTRDLTVPNLATLSRIPGKSVLLPRKKLRKKIEGNKEEIVESKTMFAERLVSWQKNNQPQKKKNQTIYG